MNWLRAAWSLVIGHWSLAKDKGPRTKDPVLRHCPDCHVPLELVGRVLLVPRIWIVCADCGSILGIERATLRVTVATLDELQALSLEAPATFRRLMFESSFAAASPRAARARLYYRSRN